MTRNLPTTLQVWLPLLVFALITAVAIANSFGLLQEWGLPPSSRRSSTPAPPWVGMAFYCALLSHGLAEVLAHYDYRIAATVARWIAGTGTVIAFIGMAMAFL